MKVRKRVVKVLCLFIRVSVLISLVGSTIKLRDGNYLEGIWCVYGGVLIAYLCTFSAEDTDNLLIHYIIAGILKIFIIMALLGLVIVQYIYKFTMLLAVCNFIAYIGYFGEQLIRFVYWCNDIYNQ